MRDQHIEQKTALLNRPTTIERDVVLAQYQKTKDKIAKLQTEIGEILKFPQNLASLPRNGEGVKQEIQKLEKDITQHQQEIDRL